MTLDELIARNGPVCVWCGRGLWRRDLTAEHLLPRSRGGRGDPENLAVACRSCNRHRRSRGVAAYVQAQLAAGLTPRLDLLEAALSRLSASASPRHADYGHRQLELLRRRGSMLPAVDLGATISYLVLQAGVPVFSSDAQEVARWRTCSPTKPRTCSTAS